MFHGKPAPTIADVMKAISTVSAKVDALTELVKTGNKVMADVAAAMTALEAQVTANTDAEASAVLLLQKLSQMIAANAGDPTKVNELAAKLNASATALAAAIVANTPAA